MSNPSALRSHLRNVGPLGKILFAVLLLGACAPQRQATGPFARFSEFEGREIRRVTFTGDLRIPRDSLAAVIRTRPSRCRFFFLPVCIPFTDLGREERRLDLAEVANDVARIQLYHRDHGYYGAQVAPDIEPAGEDRVSVEFVIAPGRQVELRELAIQGTDTIVPAEALFDAIPLEVGEPFGRTDFLASADTIRSRLLERGHAYADVLRNYGIDTIAGVAEAEYVAIPGPVVYVDTVVFEGNDRLTERVLRRQIAVSEGDVLRSALLAESQRNLYNLGMINFASVRLAPDTLQREQERERATVLVQVVEAAQYAVDASIGFGTVDCIRARGLWVNRNFLGGGRRLEVLGSLSRLGVGEPADLGLGGRMCSELGAGSLLSLADLGLRDRLDYRLVADFQQPSIFGTQNRLTVNLHTERVSEVEAYIRESIGGGASAVREFNAGPTVLTTTALVERGRTIANPAILCVGFDTCSQDDLDLLRQRRWSNSLTVGAVHDAQWTDGINSRGYVLRAGVDWSSPVLGSQDNYLRVLTEGSYYYPLQPGWVLAANLRVGRFLQGRIGDDSRYIPPERRFYAGGPNSVRGYSRNALGPTVYILPPESEDVVGSASGGTQLVVSTLELRMPSPWISDIARLAAFVDAGQLTAPGAQFLSEGSIRVTPGAGLRILTPVGPFRLDIAYNPYEREPGPLYRVDPTVGLVLEDPEFQPESPSFLGRFRIQFALGQAF